MSLVFAVWTNQITFPVPRDEASQSKTATYSFQIAQAALLSNDHKADQNRCRHRLCSECPEGPAWASWLGYWHI